MKKYGRSTVSEFLEDFVVYRNLDPIDARLPSLAEIRQQIGISATGTPRKTSPEYARVIASLLQAANELGESASKIERVVFVGDTRLNDGTAFQNICLAGNWPGMAFVASEDEAPPQLEVDQRDAGTLIYANRWAAIGEFRDFCQEQDFKFDERTVVLLDLDKTTLGARGRNDKIIDHVRLEAGFQTVSGLLGEDFDSAGFQTAYERLNQPEYHPFTADNQDFLVYICLILGGGLIDLDELVVEVNSARMVNFEQFIGYVNQNADRLPAKLGSIHQEVFARVSQGDPTPFKEFRYKEYETTAAHMGNLDPAASVEDLLSKTITITQEVRQAALTWKSLGVLLFGISDKPDEASLPTEALAQQGWQPIHRIETDIVGE
jgi:hypothetical protein